MLDTSKLVHFAGPSITIVLVALCTGLLLQKYRASYLSGIVGAVSVGLAAVLGLFLEEGLSLPADRDWHYAILAILLAAVVAVIPQRVYGQANIQAVVLAGIAGVAAYQIFSHSERDDELSSQQTTWIIGVASSVLLNYVLFRRVYQNAGAGWSSWVLVAQIGTVVVSLMMVYATLGYAATGLFTSAVVLSAAASIAPYLSALHSKKSSDHPDLPDTESNTIETSDSGKTLSTPLNWIAVAFAPVVVGSSLLAACFRVWNYGMVHNAVYLPILFLPTCVFSIDTLFLSKKNTGLRILIAALSALAISLAIIGYIWMATASESY